MLHFLTIVDFNKMFRFSWVIGGLPGILREGDVLEDIKPMRHDNILTPRAFLCILKS